MDDKETMLDRGLRRKIREYLQGKYTAFISEKVMRIIDGFKTVNEFCVAEPSAWLSAYREARPSSSVDLGQKSLRAIDDAIAFVKDEALSVKKEVEEKERRQKEEADAKARAEEERRLKEARENPRFSLGELKALAAMMELCNITAIDLKTIKNILAAMEVKIQEDGNGKG